MKSILSILLLIFAFSACKNNNVESQSTVGDTTAEMITEESNPMENNETAIANTDESTDISSDETTDLGVVSTKKNKSGASKSSATKGDESTPKNTPNTGSTEVTGNVKEVIKDTRPEKPPMIESAPPVTEPKEPMKQPAVSIHDDFDAFLKSYVSNNGKVNYNKIKANPTELEKVLKTLQDNPVQDSWSKNKKLAYWINAYNAFTIKKIIDNYPVKSITDLDGGKPWDTKFIKLGGKTYSLNNIENDIIRPKFNDPRIHFAVNCAAKSCPPLLNKAYTEENVNSLLTSQTKKFINNDGFNQLKGDAISVSKIFDWYKVDFGDLISFINKYSDTKVDPGTKVAYTEYNWSLNN